MHGRHENRLVLTTAPNALIKNTTYPASLQAPRFDTVETKFEEGLKAEFIDHRAKFSEELVELLKMRHKMLKRGPFYFQRCFHLYVLEKSYEPRLKRRLGRLGLKAVCVRLSETCLNVVLHIDIAQLTMLVIEKTIEGISHAIRKRKKTFSDSCGQKD